MSDQAATIRTKVSPKWLGKQLVFILIVTGFALWALADAVWIYPKRGEEAAEFLKLQYLRATLAPGVLEKVGVEDPANEIATLRLRDRTSLSSIQRLRLEWLEALRNAGKLTPERTNITPDVARSEMERLDKFFGKAAQPKPLSQFDIPLQWIILVVCGAIALMMVWVLLRTMGTSYAWDPATRTLTLPSGVAVAPGDVELFDKRKWDKFLLFLKIKAGSHALAGSEVKLDLLRFVPLEEWALEMEKTAFPPAEVPPGEASPSAMMMTQPGTNPG
ncbi:MAG TPA: hypothetical protein VK176_00015 [Phycisphaerales bacterium]|nr:hypothetical protein [Phycisphaerales bacterium]